jgi:putative peptide zinc metalloprotease protein
MDRFSSERHVFVESFTRQPERDGIVIGRPDLSVFLVLPAEAVEVLDDLARGRTVGDAQTLYRERHGETPEMEMFLTALEQRGFVRPGPLQSTNAAQSGAEETMTALPGPPAPKSPHFDWISPRWAGRLFGKGTLTIAAMLVAFAIAAVVATPGLVPGWRAVYFPKDTAAGLLCLMLLGVVTTFIHEMAHLVAARACGVSCRFGISNRLWFVVWETDMTGIWALPRSQRYLPILAGPLIDIVSAAALILVFFAGANGWLALAPRTEQFGRAVLFMYLMRVLFQCYFFVRTDFYYAITNLLGCKNLMQDTQRYLKNLCARVFLVGTEQDQSHIPEAERRMLAVYSVIWMAGRTLAFTVLLFVQIPLLFHYLALFASRFLGGTSAAAGNGSTASLLSGLFFLALLFAGMGMWLRQLLPQKGATT